MISAMKMHLEERAETFNPKNGFLGRPYPIEHPRLPIIDSTTSHFSMTTRHGVDMEQFSSARVLVNIELQQAEAPDNKRVPRTREISPDISTLISAGMSIPTVGLEPAVGTKKSIQTSDTKVATGSPVEHIILPPLAYEGGQPHISQTLPTDDRAQRYRSPCQSPESPDTGKDLGHRQNAHSQVNPFTFNSG
jgi:hypothetical protein